MRVPFFQLAVRKLAGEDEDNEELQMHMPFSSKEEAAAYLRELTGEDHGVDSHAWAKRLDELGPRRLYHLGFKRLEEDVNSGKIPATDSRRKLIAENRTLMSREESENDA